MFIRLFATSILVFAAASGCAKSHAAATPDVERLVADKQEFSLRPTVGKSSRRVIKDLVVFGDSLSDTGLLHDRTFGFYLPGQVYWRGRASNGPVWVDYFCGALSCQIHNYAMAGAATRRDGFPVNLVLSSLSEQVDQFIADDLPLAQATSLAVIWIGPNDYLSTEAPKEQPVASEIKAAAQRLLAQGFERVAVGSMPDLSSSLKAPNSGRKSDRVLQRLTQAHNLLIDAVLAELRPLYPSKTLLLFDAHATNQATVQDPKAYGFTNLKTACYQGSYSGEFFGAERFCDDFMEVKMWDYLHPNSRMHCHYAAGFLKNLKVAGVLTDTNVEAATPVCRHLPSRQQ